MIDARARTYHRDFPHVSNCDIHSSNRSCCHRGPSLLIDPPHRAHQLTPQRHQRGAPKGIPRETHTSCSMTRWFHTLDAKKNATTARPAGSHSAPRLHTEHIHTRQVSNLPDPSGFSIGGLRPTFRIQAAPTSAGSLAEELRGGHRDESPLQHAPRAEGTPLPPLESEWRGYLVVVLFRGGVPKLHCRELSPPKQHYPD